MGPDILHTPGLGSSLHDCNFLYPCFYILIVFVIIYHVMKRIHFNFLFIHTILGILGKPKGQGQSQDVLRNRAHKEQNKAGRANHNRKAASQYKQTRGMF